MTVEPRDEVLHGTDQDAFRKRPTPHPRRTLSATPASGRRGSSSRGWYNGKDTDFPWSKKPRFDRLEAVIEFDRWAPRLIIKEGELKRYKDTLAILKLPRAGRAKVIFEHLPPK